MNGNLKWIRENWMLLAFFASLVAGWTTLNNDSKLHGEKLKDHTEKIAQCHDFMQRQDEINKKIDKFDDKLDRLIRRQSRGAFTEQN